MRFSFAVLLIAMLAACSSGSGARPADLPQADVNVMLRAPLMFGSSRVASAGLDVTVRNQATVPIRVRRIQLSSPAMVEYAIRPVERAFNDALAPGETKTFSILAEAVSSSAGLSPSEPLNVRAVIQFEEGKRSYRDVFTIMSANMR